MSSKVEGRLRRKLRVRKRVSGSTERPRLTVFRSNKQIYAQVIDDTTGKTLAAAGSIGLDKVEGAKKGSASAVGEKLAAVCVEKGITQVVFDRNGYIYTGRVKALADGARKGGLQF
jgi:large subunit ribosomal protein L18